MPDLPQFAITIAISNRLCRTSKDIRDGFFLKSYDLVIK